MVDAELLGGLQRFDHVQVAWNRRMEGCTETDDGVTTVEGAVVLNREFGLARGFAAYDDRMPIAANGKRAVSCS